MPRTTNVKVQIKKRPKPRPKAKVKPRPKKNKGWGHKSTSRILEETFVYLMWNFPFFFLNKFGISDKTKNRVKNVSDTTPGIVNLVATFNLPFGYKLEQFIHALYRLQNVHFWTGSGRTEWFLVFSPIVGTSALFLNHFFGLGLISEDVYYWKYERAALAYFTPFLWLDGLFWLVLFKGLRFLSVLAVILLFVYFLSHIK